MGVSGMPSLLASVVVTALLYATIPGLAIAAGTAQSAIAESVVTTVVAAAVAALQVNKSEPKEVTPTLAPGYTVIIDVSQFCCIGDYHGVSGSRAHSAWVATTLCHLSSQHISHGATHVYWCFDTAQDHLKTINRGKLYSYRNTTLPARLRRALKKDLKSSDVINSGNVSITGGVADRQIQLLILDNLPHNDILIVGWDTDLLTTPFDQVDGDHNAYMVKVQGLARAEWNNPLEKADFLDLRAGVLVLHDMGLTSTDLICAAACLAGNDYCNGVFGWGLITVARLCKANANLKTMAQVVAVIEDKLGHKLEDTLYYRLNLSFVAMRYIVAIDNGRWTLLSSCGGLDMPLDSSDSPLSDDTVTHLTSHLCLPSSIRPGTTAAADYVRQVLVGALGTTSNAVLPHGKDPNQLRAYSACEVDEFGCTMTPDATMESLFDNGLPTWANYTANKDEPGTWVIPPAGDWVVASGSDTLKVWKKDKPSKLKESIKTDQEATFFKASLPLAMLHEYWPAPSPPVRTMVHMWVDGQHSGMVLPASIYISHVAAPTITNFLRLVFLGGAHSPARSFTGKWMVGAAWCPTTNVLHLQLSTAAPAAAPVAIKAYIGQTRVSKAGWNVVCRTLKFLFHDPAVVENFLNVPSGDLSPCTTRIGFSPVKDVGATPGQFQVSKYAAGSNIHFKVDSARVANVAVVADVFALIIAGTSTNGQPTALNYDMDTYCVNAICSVQAGLRQTARTKDEQQRADAVRVLLLGVGAPASQPAPPLAVIDANIPLPARAPSSPATKAPRKRQRGRENTPPTTLTASEPQTRSKRQRTPNPRYS